MSEQLLQSLEERADKLLCSAKKAQRKFENLFKVLIVSILMAIVSVTLLTNKVSNNKKSIEAVRDDYAPLWLVAELNENIVFAIKETAITFSSEEVDTEKLNDLLDKYKAFQTRVMNRLAQDRGGNTNTTRSFKGND